MCFTLGDSAIVGSVTFGTFCIALTSCSNVHLLVFGLTVIVDE